MMSVWDKVTGECGEGTLGETTACCHPHARGHLRDHPRCRHECQRPQVTAASLSAAATSATAATPGEPGWHPHPGAQERGAQHKLVLLLVGQGAGGTECDLAEAEEEVTCAAGSTGARRLRWGVGSGDPTKEGFRVTGPIVKNLPGWSASDFC